MQPHPAAAASPCPSLMLHFESAELQAAVSHAAVNHQVDVLLQG